MSYWSLIRNRDFSKLLLGQIISTLGDRVADVAIVILVYRLTGSPIAVGFSLFFGLLPMVILGPVAGVFVDRWDRKRTMIACDLVRAALAFSLVWATSIYFIYIVLFLLRFFRLFFTPARSASIPHLVERGQLVTASSLGQGTDYLTWLLGPMVGGIIVGAVGAQGAFLFDAWTFLFSAGAIALLSLPKQAPRQRPGGARTILSDMVEGLHFIYQDKIILFYVSLFMSLAFAFGTLSVVLVVYVEEVLHQGAEMLGTLLSVEGAGLLIAAVVISQVGSLWPRRSVVTALSALLGVALACTMLNPGWVLMLALMTLVGFVQGGVSVLAQATLMESVPTDLRGRVFGTFNSGVNVTNLLAMGSIGFLVALVGPGSTIALSGGIVLLTVAVLRTFVQDRDYVSSFGHARRAEGNGANSTNGG
jgi:MFS family permease